MACAGCGTGVDGKPSGCKSNGGCSTGGCNRLNVFDWLSNIPLGDSLAPFDIIEVSFNNGSRKDFFRNVTKQFFDKGEMVTVEGISGFDVGTVSLTGELVKLQMKKRRAEDTPEVKKVLRRSTNDDLQRMNDNKSREKEALIKSRALARNLGLEMKLAEVEIQADGRKATFFYTADDRVDFRELIKVYASEFRAKVEMRQIGARQEAGKVGGIGSCGRELCCSTWLSDFKSVNTTAARYQNLSINQAKLSGQCGRLKCCLNYELDTYLDALKDFPDDADNIETAGGVAHLQKRDIFKSLMWYSYEGSNKQYPLTISRAKEIRQLNRQGIKPEDLKPVEVVTAKPKEADLGYADVVGLISLKSLEKTAQKRKQKDKDKQKQQKGGERGERGGERGEPKQAQAQGSQRSEGRPQGQRPENRPPSDRKPKPDNRQQRQQGQGGGQPKQGREQQPRNEQQPPRSEQGPRQASQKQPGQQPAQPGQQGGNPGAPKQDRRPPRHKHRPPNPNKNNNPEKGQ
ncbi:PSP1 domain-containing protein [Chitinophaga arvensicola]|uniref:Cell fate regulator YaaT, PSP1 superfamily (Controls sporulation, competence, biofilm development) n=1 Tax=Chitinophaga arvensicola TaxID=29529 RepID=A0A1I0P418_9BACT|nr:regulatory iron-sulfur-containing complex subunit RicT [Chitinophaga arvensicola]SEW08254.1 Cell fate regulator YaaT, PSP1 superfamily (controls sporulation, competence, biofilm development) [Chitinophaga arvensicola]